MLPRIIASSPCRFELNPFKIRNTEKRIFETVSLLIGQTDSSDCTIHVVNKRRASSIYPSYNLGYFLVLSKQTTMFLAVQNRHNPRILYWHE